MSAIFLSASVPIKGRLGYETSDAYLIREAVSAFVEVVLGRRLVVWGGQPGITPMIWAAAESLGVRYADNVLHFQSRYFEDRFPEDNQKYKNVTLVEAVPGDKEASLAKMRAEMLDSQEFEAAVFIGGMEGVLLEFDLFRRRWPDAKVVAVPSPGGTARDLFRQLPLPAEFAYALDYSAWLYELLSINSAERRRNI